MTTKSEHFVDLIFKKLKNYKKKELFLENSFLVLFWIHFLAMNLFCGCWIVKDSQKFNISKSIIFPSAATIMTLAHCGVFIKKIITIEILSRIIL